MTTLTLNPPSIPVEPLAGQTPPTRQSLQLAAGEGPGPGPGPAPAPPHLQQEHLPWHEDATPELRPQQDYPEDEVSSWLEWALGKKEPDPTRL